MPQKGQGCWKDSGPAPVDRTGDDPEKTTLVLVDEVGVEDIPGGVDPPLASVVPGAELDVVAVPALVTVGPGAELVVGGPLVAGYQVLTWTRTWVASGGC